MKTPTLIIKYEKKKTIEAGYETAVNIDNFSNFKVDKGAEDKKDTFSFTIVNHREFVDGVETFTEVNDFSIEDIITVYAYYQDEYTGTLQDHFLIKGIIEEVNYNSDESSSTFDIKGSNTTDAIMNIMVPATYTGINESQAHLMIVDLVTKANGTAGVTERKIIAELATVDGSGNRTGGGYIWPTKSNGDSFPSKAYVKNYTSLYTHLKTLKSNQYTEDPNGSFIAYVDVNDNLHFEPKTISSSLTLDEYDNTPSLLQKTLGNDGMINVVIFNGGPDPNNNGIVTLAFNIQSVKKYGGKWKYLSEDRVAASKKEYERTYGPATNPGQYIDNDGYPDSYPWEIVQAGSPYSIGQTVSTDDQYKDYIRGIVKYESKDRAQRVVDVLGNPRDKMLWEPELGTLSFEPNDLVTITLDSISYDKALRVMSVSHSFVNEWKTTVQLTEDEESVPVV